MHALMRNIWSLYPSLYSHTLHLQDRIIPHTTILHSTKHPCCTIYKQHSTSFSPRTTYIHPITVNLTPNVPLHYTATLFIKLPISFQPDTHTNPHYIHIHTCNSPFIPPLQLLLTIILPCNKINTHIIIHITSHTNHKLPMYKLRTSTQ